MAGLEKLYIDSFRGINDLYLEQLCPINLIVGNNNCGKTSVLEAVEFLRFYKSGLINVLQIARQRDYQFAMEYSNSIYENVMCMFPQESQIRKIELSGIYNGKEFSYRFHGENKKMFYDPVQEQGSRKNKTQSILQGEMEVDGFEGGILANLGKEFKQTPVKFNRYVKMSDYSYTESQGLPIRYVGSFAHLRGDIINEIVRNEEYKEICVMMLKLFDKGISDILTLPSDIGFHMVSYIRHDRLGNMPLSTYGDGVKRALVLANEIAKARSGILLIDEIETSIHKQYYDDIFRFVTKACLQYNVQLFITTHSLEAVDGILKTQDYDNSTNDDKINVITLRKEGNKTLSRSMSGAEVYKDREDFGFEVRI